MQGKSWQDGVNLALAIWLFISPWVLGFGVAETAAWNAWVVSVVVAIAAIVSIARYNQQSQWVNIVLGAWLIISPWVLQAAALAPTVYWNFVIVGIAVVVFAAWNVMANRPRVRS